MARTPLITPLLVAVALAVLSGGCAGGRGWNPFPEPAAPVLLPTATQDEVVSHLNANIARCTSWQSYDVTVKSNQFPLSVTAMMAVQSPNRFRMIVSTMQMDLADLGSNDERIWFWMRPPPTTEAPSYVYTCSHEDVAAAQRKTNLPFRPDWLMEVLGVMPIDPASVEMTSVEEAGQFLIRSTDTAPDGRTFVRVMTVDARQGVIVNHALWSGEGQLLAQAKMSNHKRDEKTGVILPHEVEMSYPEENATMTLRIGSFEVNPTSFAENTWIPDRANGPAVDLVTEEIVTLGTE